MRIYIKLHGQASNPIGCVTHNVTRGKPLRKLSCMHPESTGQLSGNAAVVYSWIQLPQYSASASIVPRHWGPREVGLGARQLGLAIRTDVMQVPQQPGVAPAHAARHLPTTGHLPCQAYTGCNHGRRQWSSHHAIICHHAWRIGHIY